MTEHMTWALWAPNMAATLALAFGVLAPYPQSVFTACFVVSRRTRGSAFARR
jgi:hypothetical protein